MSPMHRHVDPMDEVESVRQDLLRRARALLFADPRQADLIREKALFLSRLGTEERKRRRA